MAAIRIQLPGRDAASLIALNGERITIGRSPANTIQILDRSMSLRHAELINEGGYYRLHDVGSTNGVFVNGQQVTDYHLREKCKMSFGTLECEFLPELPAESDLPVETLPSRAEMVALQEENSNLRARLSKLRERMEELQKDAALKEREKTSFIPREQYESAVAERETVSALLGEREKELVRLQADLSTVKQAAERVSLEEYQKLLSEHRGGKDQQRRMEEEIADQKRELTLLAAERESLQRNSEKQRMELEAMPKPAEIESLRTANAELGVRVKELTLTLASLRKVQAEYVSQKEPSVPREAHEKLVAEYEALQRAHQQHEAELTQARQQLTEFKMLCERLDQKLQIQDGEIESLRKRVEIVPSASGPTAVPEQTRLPATKDETSPGIAPELNGKQIEEVLGELGFVIRPIRRDLAAPSKNGANSGNGERVAKQPPSRSSDEGNGAK